MKLMPQELEVWYLLPALRKELARIFIKDYNLSQKKISQLFGITESAISQYQKLKRANELKFSRTEKEEIKKTASKILKDEKDLIVMKQHFEKAKNNAKNSINQIIYLSLCHKIPS